MAVNSPVTFLQLAHQLQVANKFEHQQVFNTLVYFYSRLVQNWASLIIHHNTPIDFDYQTFVDAYQKVTKEWYPLAYITKQALFGKHTFIVHPKVFIPRLATAQWVQWLTFQPFFETKRKVCEIGVGTGCIIHSLAIDFPTKKYVGIEQSAKAYQTALQNQQKHQTNVTLLFKNAWRLPIDFWKEFDLIIANPPYLQPHAPHDLGLKYEPKAALYAAYAGLAFYKRFCQTIFPFLSENTIVAFEVDQTVWKTIHSQYWARYQIVHNYLHQVCDSHIGLWIFSHKPFTVNSDQ